jgi:CDP-4-dehydro-6-deoxyglucose reductase, E1
MNKYPLASTTWDDAEIEAGINVLKTGQTSMGNSVFQFEKSFSEYFGSRFSVMVNSGSSANLLMLAALRIKYESRIHPQMEIIVPAVSWATTYFPVNQLGFKLRFVDIDLDSLNISVDGVLKAINSNTFAIFAVNLLGQPSELSQLKNIAEQYDVLLIEDNCESMGAVLNGQYCGTWGVAGSFSTFFSHHINTMEGGMVVTDDEELKDIMTSLRAHGWTRELSNRNHVLNKNGNTWEDKFKFVLPGYNLRPLEISGAIGSIQLQKLPHFLEERRKNMEYFQSIFAGLPNIKMQQGPGLSSSFGFSVILTGQLSGKRDQILEKLEKNGIETRPIVSGDFTKQPVMSRLDYFELAEMPNAAAVDTAGFFIGNHHYNLKNELDHFSKIFKETLQNL